jgi:hypothetical protein
MPKTSIAKKTRDSKSKRMFQQRAKGRHIKKMKNKSKEQNKYVDTLKKLKEREAEIKEKMLKKEEEN